MNAPFSLRPARPDDLAAVHALLEQCGLPIADLLNNSDVAFWLAEPSSGAGSVIGVIGLERANGFGLLRSLAVAPSHRSAGIARALVETAEHGARSEALRALYLIAMDERAASCLAHLGYAHIKRDFVPEALRSLAEFSGLCPDSNPCLRKILDPSFVETAIPAREPADGSATTPCGCCCKSAPVTNRS